MALVAVALVSSAGAAPTTDTTAVDFVSIPAKQTWGGNSISPGATESVVVIGGTTTVPTYATTVRLDVTVTGAAAGTIKLLPAGNPTGGPGHTVSWNAGQVVTVTTNEHPGQSNKLSVQNLSTKAAKVTIKITGYSDQVTAGDINGSGGSAGQVLTNNGTGGVIWDTLTAADVTDLQDDAWRSTASQAFSGGFVPIVSVNVPPGSYVVHFTGEFENQTAAVSTVNCRMFSPSGGFMAQTRGTAQSSFQSDSIALVGLGRTVNGGTYRVDCRSIQGHSGVLFDGSLVAVQVGTAHGTVTPSVAGGR